MRIQFHETTRGRGKIFIRMTASESLSKYDVVAIATAANGAQQPAMVLSPAGVEGYVVVLLVITQSQTLTIEVRDRPSGQVICTATQKVKPGRAKLKSRLNTLLKNSAAEKIRNIDTKMVPTWPSLDFDSYVDVLDGTALVRLSATFRAKNLNKLNNTDISFKVLGKDGANIALGDPIPMGESVSSPTDRDGLFSRRVSCSVRIPSTVTEFAAWVHSDGEFEDTFYNYEQFYVQERRNFHRSVTLSADRDPQYNEWFNTMHRSSDAMLEYQRNRVFIVNPTFSIIVPLFKTPIRYFNEMAESVLSQTYPLFELLLINASPEDEVLADAIQQYVARDSRVKVISLEENRGITENTNAGIIAAKGDFLAFLDHDDVLEPDILYHYVVGINKYPDTDLLYCDEDKLLGDEYVSPFFKPDFNIDLLCSENYVCHMLTVRRDIVDRFELPTKEYDGAQDHHLALRAAEKARNVYHARRVLYHWRMHEGSTAASFDSKAYTSAAGQKAVQEHFDRLGIKGRARCRMNMPNTYAFDYEVEQNPLVSIIIPSRDLVPMLDRCIASILDKTAYDNYEIVVVENNSTQETLDYYSRLCVKSSRIRVVVYHGEGDFSFSKLINFGVEQARGAYLLLLNNDTEVITPNWIGRMTGICQRNDVGAVGAKLLYPDDTIQHAGVAFFETGPEHLGRQMLPGNAQHYYNTLNLTADYSAVTAACLMTKRSTFDSIGGFDEELAVDYNDVDYCLRLNAIGLLCVYEPEVVLYHYESVSRGEHTTGDRGILFAKERGIMMQRYPEYYANGDPYYNPHLTGRYMALEKLKP